MSENNGKRVNDAVNHPKHYTEHPSGVECIQITEHMCFNLGNAVKYIWRCDLKKDAIEDLKKAIWYINRELGKREKEIQNGKNKQKQNETVASSCGSNQPGGGKETSGSEIQRNDDFSANVNWTSRGPIEAPLYCTPIMNIPDSGFVYINQGNFEVDKNVSYNYGTIWGNSIPSGWDLMTKEIKACS